MHAGVVHLVGAGERDQDLDEREPELLHLESEQLATDTVHADAVVRVGDGRISAHGSRPNSARSASRARAESLPPLHERASEAFAFVESCRCAARSRLAALTRAPPSGKASTSSPGGSILRSAALGRADDPRRRVFAAPNESLHGASSLCSQSHPRVAGDGSAFKTCHSRPGDIDNRRSLPPIVSLKPHYPRRSHVFRAGVGPHRFPDAPGHGFTLARRRTPASRPALWP